MRIQIAILGLIAACAACAADPATDRNWNRLSRLNSKRSVQLHLRDGRVLKGAIEEFGPDGLTFAATSNATLIKRTDIAHQDGEARQGKMVTLTLRGGRGLTGLIQELDETNLWLIEDRNLVRLKRQEIVRVTARARGLTALIGGLALGASGGIAVAADKKSDPRLAGLAGAVLGGVGAGIGAAIGRTVTLYESEPRE